VDGVYVQTGCFFDTKENFIKKVTETNVDPRYLKIFDFFGV
jgi:hypothetical protein